jgi:hypothetical protein
MAHTKKSDQQTNAKQGGQQAKQSGSVPRGGNPGDGAGRTYDPESRHSGVFPVSGPPPDDPNATFQGMASFGQGERGAAGFQDSGQSEIFTMPPEGETADDEARS